MAKALRNRVVARGDWVKARKALLTKEKKHERERAKLASARRALPWEPVTKDYVFEGAAGKQSLADLFAGRSQLVVYHFMFDPSWDEGCAHCSWWADNFDHPMQHLNHHDVSFAVVSRAPQAKLAAYRKRMGWSFPWVSSSGNDFNADFNVTFTPAEVKAKRAFYNFKWQDPLAPEREGLSVFYKDARGRIFRTYSAFARGIDPINVDYQLIDLTPKGRAEEARGNQYWIRRHDEY